MALFNDPSFMVYTKGYHPKHLCLGHLVIGDWYHAPVEAISRSCRFPLLDQAESDQWTLSKTWKGKVVARKGGQVGFGVEVFETGQVQPGIEWKGSKVLKTENGRKIELDNPQKFLDDMVLASPEVRSTLQKRLSMARSDHMFKRCLHQKPKIWMLTAVYELAGVKSSTIREFAPSINVCVGSKLVGALSRVPIGASLELQRKVVTETESFISEPQVYAGRWQLLQAEYIKLGETHQPSLIALRKDNVYYGGYAMGDGKGDSRQDGDVDAATLRLAGEDVQGLDEGDGINEEYWRQFDKAERKLTRRM